MISKETIKRDLEQGDDRGLGEGGAGLEVHPQGPDTVAERNQGRRPGPGRPLPGVHPERQTSDAPSPLKVKEVHVLYSFLALVLRQELKERLAADSHKFEWADVIRDLDRLQVVEVQQDGKRFLLRSEVPSDVLGRSSAAGVAVPPTVR